MAAITPMREYMIVGVFANFEVFPRVDQGAA